MSITVYSVVKTSSLFLTYLSKEIKSVVRIVDVSVRVTKLLA